MAFGQLGIDKTRLPYWTLRELYNAIQGRQEAKREGWEQTRALATIMANSWSDDEVEADELMPLPWDEGTEPAPDEDQPPPTIEEAQQIADKHERIQREGTTIEAHG